MRRTKPLRDSRRRRNTDMIIARDIFLIVLTIFLQYMVINIFPIPFARVDLFLILAGIYAIKYPVARSLLFVFLGGLVMELVYPVSTITGLKTMSALTLAFILFQFSRKIDVKGVAACLTVGVYALLTIWMTRGLSALLGLPLLSIPTGDYLVFFVITSLVTALVIERFNVQ